MANILGDDKRQQILALGRLGGPLRRIEEATGVRRETPSAYLKAAGIAIRAPRRRRPPPKPASEVSTDPRARPPSLAELPAWPPPSNRAPTASACAPYRELIELALSRGRNAMAIWQDLVDEHGFPARYASVRRFVVKLRGQRTPDAHPVITTAPGEEGQVDYGEGPMVRHPGTGKYRRTRLFVFTLGFSRKSVRLLTLRVKRAALGRAARRDVSSARRHRRRRGPRQSQGRRAHARRLRSDPQPALPRCARALRRRRAALSCRRPGSEGESRVGDRPHPEHAAQGAALRESRRGAGVSRPLGGALGRYPYPRHHQASGRRHVHRGTAASPTAAARALSLLPLRHPHRASRRLCRSRRRLLRPAAGLARPRGRRPVGRSPRPAPRPHDRRLASRAPAP